MITLTVQDIKKDEIKYLDTLDKLEVYAKKYKETKVLNQLQAYKKIIEILCET